MKPSSSPYRDLYKGSTFLAVGEVHDVQREELELVTRDFAASQIMLEHVPHLTEDVLNRVRRGVREVFILRQEGGIVDQSGRLITLATRGDIERFLCPGESPASDIPDLNGAGRNALYKARDTLDAGAGRAVITSPALIRREVDEWQGAGTLLLNEDLLVQRPIEPRDRAIVRYVMDDLIAKKDFRARSDEEAILERHHVLDAKGVLGGASLLPWQDGDFELARLWTGHQRNGLGCTIAEMIIDAWKREKDANRLFALTKYASVNGKSLYEKKGFKPIGPVSELRDDPSMPPQIREYAVSARDPYVYALERT
jgi:hypothetical protein